MFEQLSFDSLFLNPERISPPDYFKPDHLRRLFAEKIARSGATGKDGIRMDRFEDELAINLAIIENKIAKGNYKFTTYKERLLLKGAGKPPRQISIPTIRDRLVLRAVCQILHRTVPASTGYSPHAIVDRVAKTIQAGAPNRALVRIDVKDFFPSIKHDRLRKELVHFKLDELTTTLCMGAVSTPSGSSGGLANRGVPQGLSISGALACIYMLRFDAKQSDRFEDYFRYVDDILIICDKPAAESGFVSARQALTRIGLKAHPLGTSGKSEISSISEGIDYLGYRITLDGVSIRESSFHRMFRNILKVITDFRYRRDTERLLFRLNLKITGCLVDGKRRGWMMFFARTDDLNQLAHLDRFVRIQLRRVGFPNDQISEVKTFLKSYHEIRFKLDSSSYIQKFDEFSLAEKTQVVAILSGKPMEEVETYDIEKIDREFRKLIGREVHDLENDVGSPS